MQSNGSCSGSVPASAPGSIKFSSNIEKINEYFALPISYNIDKSELDTHIITDLELVKCVDATSTPIYNYIFKPSSCFGEIMLKTMPKLYTTDKAYLKDTQQILRTHMSPMQKNRHNENENDKDKDNDKDNDNNKDKDIESFSKTGHGFKFKEIIDIYDEIKNDISFKEKYYFLDWEHLLFLNKYDWFMQLMSMYNLSSPVLSLFLPIIMLIIPFFIIKVKGLEVTVDEYVGILKNIIANHTLGKVFTKFHEVDNQQKVYLVVSAAFYVFSIYQNILVCIRFHKNMKKIYYYLNTIVKYLNYTTLCMQQFISLYSGLPSYKLFIENMQQKLTKLEEIQTKLNNIHSLDEFHISYSCLKQIGYVMTEFYEIYENKEYHNAFMYSFGFHGYMDNIQGLQENIKDKHLNYCDLLKKSSKDKKDKKDKNDKKDKKDKKSKHCKKGKEDKQCKKDSGVNAVAHNIIVKQIKVKPRINKIKE